MSRRILRLIVHESLNGGWQASVNESDGQWSVRCDADPVEAACQALRAHGTNNAPPLLAWEQMRDLRAALAGALPTERPAPSPPEPEPAALDIADLLG